MVAGPKRTELFLENRFPWMSARNCELFVTKLNELQQFLKKPDVFRKASGQMSLFRGRISRCKRFYPNDKLYV